MSNDIQPFQVETRLELEGGKYTVLHNNGLNFRALRHGEEWRSLTGDKLVFTMACEIERLSNQVVELQVATGHCPTCDSHGVVALDQKDHNGDWLEGVCPTCNGATPNLVVNPDELDEITPSCLEYAQHKRANWNCPENWGFAVEAAYQYGATVIDDDCEILAITTENMVNLMAALGFEHREPGGLSCINPACKEPAPATVVPEGKLLVSAEPLRRVLNALVNAPHQIRELQVTREPVELFADNPINVLIAEYNAAQGDET